MNRHPLRAITEAEAAAYQSDGVVLLKGLFDAGWVERLRGLAEADMENPGPLTQELAKPDESGRFYFNTFMWHRDAGFRDFVFGATATPSCRARMYLNSGKSSRASMIGPSLVPGLPKMYSTPSALSISSNAFLPVIFVGMSGSVFVVVSGFDVDPGPS